ncbi:hypothetical protein DPMN_114616 [Dreissena polymorpha]|uniref:Tudor domain-containing protein n=1 Tax=Dreissena polymorpha TaxID=45954 RepID=A0A9D4KKE3_DREPO|nr:hypothetical protein DPMN_114616 [Dreissena polymorpha]
MTSTPKFRHKIRNVSLRNCEGKELDVHKGSFNITVERSPRAPEYEVHYVKTKNDKQVLVRKKKKSFIEKHRANESKPLRNQKRDGEVTLSEDESLVQSDTTQGDTDLDPSMIGLRVIACNKNDGLYYPGYVTKTPDMAYAMVSFNKATKQKVRTQMIIPMGGAIPTPELRVGDFVLVLVNNQLRNRACYVPGIVEAVPRDFSRNPRFYTILLYNGQRDTSMRRYLVKIGRGRFEMAVKYIAHCQHQRQLRNEAKGSHTNSEKSTPRSQTDDTDSSDPSERGRRKKKKISQKLMEKKDRRKGSVESHSRRSEGDASSRSSRSRSSSASTLRTQGKEPKQCSIHRRISSGSSSESSRGSSTPRGKSPYNRPETPVPKPRPQSRESDTASERTDSHMSKDSRHVRHVQADEKDEVIQQLQAQIEKQKRKQLRQQQRLVRQARKINRISQKLKESDMSGNDSKMSNHSANRITPDLDIGKPVRQEFTRGLKPVPEVQANEEVLARWTDDGWFYRGRVVSEEWGARYRVVDATGYMEDIDRTDILTDSQQIFDVIQPQDFVVAIHPKYEFSYAPGEVLNLHGGSVIEVEFYDGNIDSVPSSDVYKISKAKYEETVEYIKFKEKQLVGKSVVARDDTTGIYKLGIVDSRVGLGQQYYVKWLDGDMSKQNTHHIFEVGLRQIKHDTCLYVLAPIDHRHKSFLPAKVISQSPLRVELCDGHIPTSSDLRMDACFWLSKSYYENALRFFKSKSG